MADLAALIAAGRAANLAWLAANPGPYTRAAQAAHSAAILAAMGAR